MLAQMVASIQGWAAELGGVGLFIVAALDSSFLSFPQVNDLLIVVLSTKYESGAASRAGTVQRFGASRSKASPVSSTASIAAYRGAAGEEDSAAHRR